MPTYTQNKYARYDYEILETMEAGLILTGAETKSIRNGGARLKGAFVTFHGDIPYLTNAYIGKYKYSGTLAGYEPDRSRRLLLNAREIRYLKGKSAEKGLTIIPLSLYTKSRHIKLEIGVGRGKKQYDKRRVIKKREAQRETQRAIKGERS